MIIVRGVPFLLPATFRQNGSGTVSSGRYMYTIEHLLENPYVPLQTTWSRYSFIPIFSNMLSKFECLFYHSSDLFLYHQKRTPLEKKNSQTVLSFLYVYNINLSQNP